MIEFIQAMPGMLVHPTFWVTALAWFSAVLFKAGLAYKETGVFRFKAGFANGGMPSTHSTFCTAATMCIGLTEGWTSAVFGVALVFTIVVVADATGLRYQAGLQAKAINKILDEVDPNHPKLKGMLGHTPFEAVIGILWGMAVAFSLFPNP